MLTLMYFRAIYYLRRELRAKEAKEKEAADRAAGQSRIPNHFLNLNLDLNHHLVYLNPNLILFQVYLCLLTASITEPQQWRKCVN